MAEQDLQIEFKTDYVDADRELYILIEDRLHKLAKGHTDIVGAAATLEQPVQNRETAYVFDASIVVYTRPTNISAREKASTPQQALKGALDAIERQVRQKREKYRENRGSLDDAWLIEEEEDTDLGENA